LIRTAFILCLLCSVFVVGRSQNLSNLRQKKIPVQAAPFKVDSLSIVPGSFTVANIPSANYLLDAVNSKLSWLSVPQLDSVVITYRVFPYSFNSKAYRYRYDSVANFFKALPSTTNAGKSTLATSDRFIDFGTMNYNGSFGRSLSFGNSQDAVVNSLFNLQISGILGDSIEVAAAITDNNIPIQPDGTTQQLNEFDRVWLQFKKRPWELNVGDIDVRQQPTYFLSFFKRQQGISFQTQTQISKNIKNSIITSGAIAKGKFTRNIFHGLEGNQGPYRLKGANNELYFVVLAGTERVFIDGVQMQRGEDQDYIIDYNTAEISFTPRRLINKDLRIQVEFEYADRNYLNSLFYVGDQLTFSNKLKLNLAWYANNDAKNSSLNQTLDENQKQFLSEIGDSIQKAYYPVATRDTFSVSKILYVKIDTTVNGFHHNIYRYKDTYDTAMYNLSFTETGAGRGNYIASLNAANGKVYEWVAPVNGLPQGNFDPVALLVTPKKQRMLTAGVTYQLTDKTTVVAEAGFSTYDINTFSSKDKGNDDGQGYKFTLVDSRPIAFAKKTLQLQSAAGYEYVSETFKPLERLRSVEFLRDWGLPFETPAATEHLPSASFKLSGNNNNSLEYAYLGYLRSDDYKGNKHFLQYFGNAKGWQLHSIFNYTHIDASTFHGRFIRPSIELNKTFAKLNNYQVGTSYSLEHNELKDNLTDTLLPSSFSFQSWNAYVRSRQDRNNRWSLSWFSRANKYPVKTAFVPLDINHTFTANLELLQNAHHKFILSAAYRILKVKNDTLTTQRSENSLLSRAEYLVNIWKGAITGNLLYEIGAGQEQRLDFTYVEVPAGTGEFTWIDYNGDGVPQLNEFEIAQFTDQAKYIRIFTPTNQYVKSSYNTFNYSILFSPRQVWRNTTVSWKKFVARFTMQSSLQTNRKQISDGSFNFNPFEGNVDDTSLLALGTNFANTVSFNRFSTNWGVDLTNIHNVYKAILTYGFETKKQNDYALKARKNFGRVMTSEFTGRWGVSELLTPNPKFDNRNYSIDYYSLEPKIIFTKGAIFRTSVSYRYDDKKGRSIAGPQSCFINSLNAEAKYNVLQSSVLNGKFTYSQIDFTGGTNTTIAYIMLDGLQPGRNLLWNFDFTKRLANALEISFQYEGRKAGDTRTVHIGRASLRAIL
jgi:hypothetical protein